MDKPVIFGVSFASDWAFYFLCLAVLIAGLWLTANLLRSPTGRAWVAIRDSEIAAQSMGVNLARYKTLAFAYSAGLMGAAGALFAHKIGFLAPDIFTRAPVHPVPVDGRGGRPRQPARRALRRGLRGAAAGAHLGGARSRARLGRPRRGRARQGRGRRGLPLARSLREAARASSPAIFGLILVLFILFEPLGIYGRWRKIWLYFSTFPLYKAATFRRQKTYMRSERLR